MSYDSYRNAYKDAAVDLTGGRGVSLDGSNYSAIGKAGAVLAYDVKAGKTGALVPIGEIFEVEIGESVNKNDPLAKQADGIFKVALATHYVMAIAIEDKTYAAGVKVRALIVSPSIL